MTSPISRRHFLAQTSGAALALNSAHETAQAQPVASAPKKACLFGMLPTTLDLETRFKLARDVGFVGVEADPTDLATADKMRAAAEKAGIHIHSVIYGGWSPPLSAPDPADAKQSLKNAEAAIRCAEHYGADTILLVPAVVNAQTRYVDAYKRSHKAIEHLIPIAEACKITICLEEVWNNFLLSPMEFATFVDSFHSPYVQAYFDVGNVVLFAWPEDWIRTLGKRIRKVHLKDFKGGPGLFGGVNGHFANLREGSINWPEVRRAFREVNYSGYMTTELGGGDEAYLRDVSARFDKILEGV